jgi:hypothetical protein
MFAPRFDQTVLIDTTPLPENIPSVKEVGASSAPLLSASFFIGARCRDYNDDYMQCKNESQGRGEFDCMKEGRRVTRCASSVYVYCFPVLYDSCRVMWRKHAGITMASGDLIYRTIVALGRPRANCIDE